MRLPRRKDYERAVALARFVIRANRDALRVPTDRTPQAVSAMYKAKCAKGEALSDAENAEWTAALAELEARKNRGRGRPKGARDHAAHRALREAIWAAQLSMPRLRPYRNVTGLRLSQCDAIADAMRAEGFRTLCTYDAVKREMMAHRRDVKGRLGGLAYLLRRWQATMRDISRAFEPMGRGMQEAVRSMKEPLDHLRGQIHEAGQAVKAPLERMRAQVALPPETLRAIESHFKTKE
jgi:hypothetical protein